MARTATEQRMDVLWISPRGVERHAPDELSEVAGRTDEGFVWVDVPLCDEDIARQLSEVFGFHTIALRDCIQRSHLPKIHAYPDHVFLILHTPLPGEEGHVHLLELDQFIGRRYLVTLHGPLGEGVPLEAALYETGIVRQRIEAGRFRPGSPAELSHAIVSRMARRLEAHVSTIATEIAGLERRVIKGEAQNPEEALEEMFRVRHELLTVRTNAAQSREAYARMLALSRTVPPEDRPLLEDILDQFERLRSLCDEEKEFLQGVLDFYQSRTSTKMNIAMERLALIAAVILPVSAISGIYGMNLIVRGETEVWHLALVVAAMITVAGLMLRWAKRQGWW
jgi:magnesium transporter